MSKAWMMAVAAALAAAAAPVVGAEFTPLGDGSDYNNGDLLADGNSVCENCDRLPQEDQPAFDLDWQLGLRGAVTQNSDGTKVQFLALPEVSLTQNTMRGAYSLRASSEVSSDLDGNARVDALTLDGSVDYNFDAVTSAGLKGSFTLSQDDPGAPGQASNVATAPLVLGGQVNATGKRDLGAIVVDVRGNAGRTVYGETTYDDASTSANDYQNNSVAGAGGRLGYRLTPGLTAFVDGQATYEAYDEASPSLLVKLDNTTYEARAGLNFKALTVLELEGSLGLGYRDFAEGSLNDFIAVLYDGKAIVRPDETLTLTGTFTTALESPGTTSGATSRVTYAAAGDIAYQVNPWLRLRGSAGWSEAHYQGIATDEYKWNVGLGADYLINERMDATADYTFSRTTTTPDPAEEEQRVMLGLTIKR